MSDGGQRLVRDQPLYRQSGTPRGLGDGLLAEFDGLFPSGLGEILADLGLRPDEATNPNQSRLGPWLGAFEVKISTN